MVRNMKHEHFYYKNNEFFYIDQPIRILKVFWKVHMAKVFCLNNQKKFVIDLNAISEYPIKEISISLGLLKGEK